MSIIFIDKYFPTNDFRQNPISINNEKKKRKEWKKREKSKEHDGKRMECETEVHSKKAMKRTCTYVRTYTSDPNEKRLIRIISNRIFFYKNIYIFATLILNNHFMYTQIYHEVGHPKSEFGKYVGFLSVSRY